MTSFDVQYPVSAYKRATILACSFINILRTYDVVSIQDTHQANNDLADAKELLFDTHGWVIMRSLLISFAGVSSKSAVPNLVELFSALIAKAAPEFSVRQWPASVQVQSKRNTPIEGFWWWKRQGESHSVRESIREHRGRWPSLHAEQKVLRRTLTWRCRGG